MVHIPNYKLEGSCRQTKRGGGVALYIKQDIVYKIRNDLKINNHVMESYFIEIVNIHKPNVIIGIVYKPPCSSCSDFIEHFDKILSCSNTENKKNVTLWATST